MIRDVVVVGGGPAGAYAAALLADAGRDVLLIERTHGPHPKVCGEFLSHEAIFYLRRLVLDPLALGAVPITSVSLIRGEAVATTNLPFAAVSLSRTRLDEALIAHAEGSGAEVRRGCRVGDVRQQDGHWRIADGQGEIIARDVFLATGKHDLRGWKRPAGKQDDLIGFKQQFRVPAASPRVELHLFDGGYCGVEPVEDGLLNVSLLVRKQTFARHGSWEALWPYLLGTCPHLAARVDGGAPVMARPLSVTSIPYGYVRRNSDGAWHLGDQAAVIPSFAGDGIAMALHSAHLAVRHLLDGLEADVFQQAFARDVHRQVARATLLSRLMVQPAAQKVLSLTARHFPQAMTRVATGTRLPEHLLGRGV